MGHHYQQHCGNQEPELVLVPDLFAKQKDHPGAEHEDGCYCMVMPFPAMIKRIQSYCRCQQDHEHFEIRVIDNIKSKQWERLQEQRQQGAVDGAGERSTDTQSVPIDLYSFHEAQIYLNATLLQKIC
jgi:hypothetical protein